MIQKCQNCKSLMARYLTYIDKRASDTSLGSFSQIGIRKNDSTCFTTQLHEYGLQILASCCSYDPSNGSAPREIDLADVGMGYEYFCDLSGILRSMDEHVQDPRG